MRLHYHPLSSYSRKATMAIGLRGDDIELVTLDVFAGALRSKPYEALNPFRKMPVLETDEGPIYESTSIIEYLEERGPRRLIPSGQERRARHFDRLADLYLLDPVGKFFWNKADDVRDNAESVTARAWPLWEKALADGRPFVCGKDITLADLGAAVAVHYATTEGLTVPDPIQRYRDRLEENPIVRKSVEGAAPFVESTKPRRTVKS